jgi:hypothetical protein
MFDLEEKRVKLVDVMCLCCDEHQNSLVAMKLAN